MKDAAYWDEQWIREELAGEGVHDRLAFYRRVQRDALESAAQVADSLLERTELGTREKVYSLDVGGEIRDILPQEKP